jgi:hypothetical protein
MPLARWLCSAQRTRTTMAGVLRGLKGTVKSIARHQP